MAQQKGIIPLKGTIGNITFYKSKDGFMAREKTSLDGKRIATDAGFSSLPVLPGRRGRIYH